MGQTMEEGAGLTARQKQFLAVVLQTPYILKRFYLTGGTALSYWYLHHRKSQDIDLFSESEIEIPYLTKWFRERKETIGYDLLQHSEQFGFNTFHLTFLSGDVLKVEFNYYPSERIAKSTLWRGLQIDSLYDLAVNKLQTLTQSPRGRDYVDLYFILRQEKYSLDQLRKDAGAKFGIYTDTIHLARQFLRVSEFEDLPEMIVPFDRQAMEKFFVALARSLKPEIFSA